MTDVPDAVTDVPDAVTDVPDAVTDVSLLVADVRPCDLFMIFFVNGCPAHEGACDELGTGTDEQPFHSIGAAAQVAGAGDCVIIGAGIYRELVAPSRGGKEGCPLTFCAAPGARVIVTGADVFIPRWEHVEGRVFRALLPLAAGQYNPFATSARDLPGDKTLGQFFRHGELLPEAGRGDDLHRLPGAWKAVAGGTALEWHCPQWWGQPDEQSHADALEITVRAQIFRPAVRGLGWITLRNLEFAAAANQSVGGFWAQGAPQAGAVSFRSGHHFTLEGCTVRHANAVGLDCGSENEGRALDGQECPPLASIGFHLIQGNVLCDNGEAGMVGINQTGTRVIGNRIERNNARGFGAVEEAGIKFHYFVDGEICGNLVRGNDAHGIWLDNVWHGSRVSRNVCLGNVGSGIFIEMGRGPLLVDNNVCAFTSCGEGIYTHDASGVTLAHNLLFGNAHFGIHCRTVTDRDVENPAYSGQWERVATGEQHIQNNVFVDNYRGALCLAPPSERDHSNTSDWNLFLGGAQWQWEAQAWATFALSGAGGRLLSLDEWRAQTGWDTRSAAPHLEAGEVVNGALHQGGMRLAHAAWLDLRDASAFCLPCPPVAGAALDLNGDVRQGASTPPGPWARLDAGYNLLPLWPLAPVDREVL